MNNFHCRNLADTFAAVKSSPGGLSEGQVAARIHTRREDNQQKKPSIISKFFAQFFDLMIIILLLAALLSIVIGIIEKTASEIVDGGVILFIVLMNAIFGVIQEHKAEKSMEALGRLSQPESQVLRDGQLKKISSSDLVIGDIVVLDAGCILPADLRLIESHQLKIDESSLTGESHAIDKDAQAICNQGAVLGERVNMAYKGSVVTCGRGQGVVVALGEDTELGKIAKVIGSNTRELTPLQKSIKDVGKILTYLVLAIAAITFIIELCINPANIMDAFLTAVAISVAAIPESMPAVITIIMSLGVARLAKQKAIVRRLHSVETLGCCDVICSDKTGTITENKMTVSAIFADGGSAKENYKPLADCAILCNDAMKSGKRFSGDPTEVALVEYFEKQGCNVEKVRFSAKRINENPFDSNRKMMSVLVEQGGQKTCFTKGALDRILKKCDSLLKNGQVVQMTAAEREMILRENDKMSAKALRVLAFACKQVTTDQDFTESGLTFIGLVGMIDPPRKEMVQAIKKCRRAGMRPIMITGDYSQTAFAIAKEIGLARSESEVLSGSSMAKMSDEQLEKNIDKFSVFARVSPADKVRIVEIFKKRGHVVAMTGDGVNDAPSLKKASIGIGMGQSGTDVAKEVSDIIITDDNFATIVVAVEEGRKIYQNIQKTVKFLFSANLAELFSLFFVTLIFPQYIFLLPVQILFVNLITDSLPAIALGLERPEKDLMALPPRDWRKGLFSDGIGWSIVVLGFAQTAFVVLAYTLGITLYSERVAVTLAFYTLNILQMFFLASMRTNENIFKSKPLENKFFLLAVGFCFLVIGLFAFTPLRLLLGLAQLSFSQWLIVFGLSLAMLVFSEIYKVCEKAILAKKADRKVSRKKAGIAK